MSIVRIEKKKGFSLSKINPNIIESENTITKVYVFGICCYEKKYFQEPF
jgi:hypothetical protein